MPLLQARQMARAKCAALDRRLVMSVQGNATCRMLMTMPGIGPITAVAYVAALERPDTFKQSRAVAAWLGLTPRRFQSGEIDYDGHISRRGDSQLRALLYEAASVLLTRVRKESALRCWDSRCGSGSGSSAPLLRLPVKWRWYSTPCGSLAHHSIPNSASPRHKSNHMLTVFVTLCLSNRDVPAGTWARPFPWLRCGRYRTARKTLGGHTLERPSCGGFMPTAETTLIPAYSANQQDETKTKIVDRQLAIRQRSRLPRLGPNDFLQADRGQPSQRVQKHRSNN